MADSPMESAKRLSLQTIRAMDEWSNRFRRELRRCAIQLASTKETALTPDLVSGAVATACNAMARQDDENDERRPQVA